MEIIIGSSPQIGKDFPAKQQPATSGAVEAKLLHVRKPRQGIAGPSGMERRQKPSKDPIKGRVLTLLVPDAALLPKDLENTDYRVHLRFSRK